MVMATGVGMCKYKMIKGSHAASKSDRSGGAHHTASGVRSVRPTRKATYLFRLAFVISLRRAGPSSGLSSSNAHKRSSETLNGRQ